MPRTYKDSDKPQNAFILILQLGINMLVPILLCTLLGSWLSKKTGYDWIAIVLIVVGVIAGFNGCWRMVKRFVRKPGEENDKKA